MGSTFPMWFSEVAVVVAVEIEAGEGPVWGRRPPVGASGGASSGRVCSAPRFAALDADLQIARPWMSVAAKTRTPARQVREAATASRGEREVGAGVMEVLTGGHFLHDGHGLLLDESAAETTGIGVSAGRWRNGQRRYSGSRLPAVHAAAADSPIATTRVRISSAVIAIMPFVVQMVAMDGGCLISMMPGEDADRQGGGRPHQIAFGCRRPATGMRL
jgi:hypothetical protein